jgi:hypothetical protein
MPSRDVGYRGEKGAPVPTHVYFFRVTSHVKAMEDAVELGLRSAFNEANFNSFSRVLPSLKLRGECLQASWGAMVDCSSASLLAGKQALSYYFIDQLHEFLHAALEWYNSHDHAEITPFLKEYGERLKARVQVGFG